jgi:dGTPase
MEQLSPTDRLSESTLPEREKLEPKKGRSAGERDSDRIISSSAFQRLAGITQVVPAGTGNAAHSRLTHSLKVGRVARRLAQRVLERQPGLDAHLDPDSVEAAGLAHDIGHPPFGHVAEKELNALMEKFGGFEGNAQSFRIVTRLAHRFPGIDGLDLTRGTLDGLLKYPWPRARVHQKADRKHWDKWGAYDEDGAAFEFARQMHPGGSEEKSLAAEVMDWADDLTYAVHDLEDFYRAGAVPLDRLYNSEVEAAEFAASIERECDQGGRLERAGLDPEEIKEEGVWVFGQLLGFDAPYAGTRRQRQELRERSNFLIGSFMDAFKVLEDGSVRISPWARNRVEALKQLTWHYVINRPELSSVQEGQRRVIRLLFETYATAPGIGRSHLLPPLERELIERGISPERVAADFIARLTEDRALELYRRISGQAAWTLPLSEH